MPKLKIVTDSGEVYLTCEKCKVSKLESEYAKHRRVCRQCRAEYIRNLKISRKDYFKEYNRNYFQNNKEYFKEWRSNHVRTEHGWKLKSLNSARFRAKKVGVPFTITIEDIHIPEFCPVLGIKLHLADKTSNNDNVPSLDRIVPSKGYVPGNVCVISYRANRIKNDATLEELRNLVSWLEKI